MTEATIAATSEGFDLTTLLEGFDLASMLPDLESVLENVELAVRVCVLAGPVVLLILGLWYLLLPPREANHHVGFRTYWGMGSVEAWRFTQLTAGILWSLMGIVLLIVMNGKCKAFQGMEALDMVWLGVEYLILELGLVAISCIVISLAVFIVYNFHGEKRKLFRKKTEQMALDAKKARSGQPPRKRPAHNRPESKSE